LTAFRRRLLRPPQVAIRTFAFRISRSLLVARQLPQEAFRPHRDRQANRAGDSSEPISARPLSNSDTSLGANLGTDCRHCSCRGVCPGLIANATKLDYRRRQGHAAGLRVTDLLVRSCNEAFAGHGGSRVIARPLLSVAGVYAIQEITDFFGVNHSTVSPEAHRVEVDAAATSATRQSGRADRA
jgi:hypothetical protein